MKLRLIGGRDLRPDDMTPGAALVNETFARQYFNGENPVGKSFLRTRTTVRQRFLLLDPAAIRAVRIDPVVMLRAE